MISNLKSRLIDGMLELLDPVTGATLLRIDAVGQTITVPSGVTFSADGIGSILVSQLSDASANGRSLLTAADYAAMRTLLSLDLANASEVNAGSSSTKVVTPDALAGSTFGSRSMCLQVFGPTTDVATGDGKLYVTIPEELNGMNLIAVHARVITAGTTGTTDIQIANVTDSVDMLSTKLTIDSTETGSNTAASTAVIDTSHDDVATNDTLRIDVDAVSSTAPKGLLIRLRFQLP